MAKFPTYEQMAKNVAEKALDEYLIDGKTIREWMKIIAEQEPQTGHWMRKTKVDGVYDIAGVKTWGIKCQCDKCDFTTIVIEDFGYYKYCPNCRAKMVAPQESEG